MNYDIIVLKMVTVLASILFILGSPYVFSAEVNGRITVEILALSGSPDNPSFELTEQEQIDLLREKLKNLPIAGGIPGWPRLGFNGFRLINQDIPDFPNEIFVFNGFIQVGIGQEAEFFSDVNRIECLIKELAMNHGFEQWVIDLLNSIICEAL